MIGDADAISCVATTSRLGLLPAAITACSRAMIGDADTVACLGALAGTRYEPTQLVEFCARNEIGDDATIDCISRWK